MTSEINEAPFAFCDTMNILIRQSFAAIGGSLATLAQR